MVSLTSTNRELTRASAADRLAAADTLSAAKTINDKLAAERNELRLHVKALDCERREWQAEKKRLEETVRNSEVIIKVRKNYRPFQCSLRLIHASLGSATVTRRGGGKKSAGGQKAGRKARG